MVRPSGVACAWRQLLDEPHSFAPDGKQWRLLVEYWRYIGGGDSGVVGRNGDVDTVGNVVKL